MGHAAVIARHEFAVNVGRVTPIDSVGCMAELEASRFAVPLGPDTVS
jgi:hypothetical protein